MPCKEFREHVDSYLKDELPVETNHDVIQHLEACAAANSPRAVRFARRCAAHSPSRRNFKCGPILPLSCETSRRRRRSANLSIAQPRARRVGSYRAHASMKLQRHGARARLRQSTFCCRRKSFGCGKNNCRSKLYCRTRQRSY